MQQALYYFFYCLSGYLSFRFTRPKGPSIVMCEELIERIREQTTTVSPKR